MSASRLVSILILLQLRSPLTAEALAEEFEVSIRTIYRDIDRLSAAGVPVYGDRGPGGGFQLLGGYKTRLTGLDADEAGALLMAGLPGPAGALGIGEAAIRARRKMLAALPPKTLETAGTLGERFHLDMADWYHLNDPPSHLPMLASALFEGRRISILYESWSQNRAWTLNPLGLVLKGGNWYLVGQSQGKQLTFRVSNMRDLAVTNETFVRPTGFVLAAWWAESLLRFEAELRPITAQLRVSPLGLKRLAALGAFAEAAVGQAGEPASDGWHIVQLPVETGDHSALSLLGIGPEFEVLAPVSLRRRIADLALGIARRAEASAPAGHAKR
jgi:predicted DNA-binding transcriptional regulator YafY